MTALPGFITPRLRVTRDRVIRAAASTLWSSGMAQTHSAAHSLPRFPTRLTQMPEGAPRFASNEPTSSTTGISVPSQVQSDWLLGAMPADSIKTLIFDSLSMNHSGQDILNEWVLGAGPGHYAPAQDQQQLGTKTAEELQETREGSDTRQARLGSVSRRHWSGSPSRQAAAVKAPMDRVSSLSEERVVAPVSAESLPMSRKFAVVIESSQPSQNTRLSASQAEPGRFGGVLPRRSRRHVGF